MPGRGGDVVACRQQHLEEGGLTRGCGGLGVCCWSLGAVCDSVEKSFGVCLKEKEAIAVREGKICDCFRVTRKPERHKPSLLLCVVWLTWHLKGV